MPPSRHEDTKAVSQIMRIEKHLRAVSAPHQLATSRCTIRLPGGMGERLIQCVLAFRRFRYNALGFNNLYVSIYFYVLRKPC